LLKQIAVVQIKLVPPIINFFDLKWNRK